MKTKFQKLYEVVLESKNTIRLYRGLEKSFNSKHDLTTTDSVNGYSTWTDNPKLAREYAGKNGYVYYIDLLKSEMGNSMIDENPKSETYGDRYLFIKDGKSAGLHGVKGNEYLLYTKHDLYDVGKIKELRSI